MRPAMLALLPLLVTTACYSHETVGVSSRPDTEEHAASAQARFPSKIVARQDERLTIIDPRAGDVDGDGLADFLVYAERLSLDDQTRRPLLYLFYGKPEFPAELGTNDAEAAFEVDAGYNGAVGDLNGDGFDDLILGQFNAANIIFGKRERLHGLIERSTGGVMWTVGALPPPFAEGQLIDLRVAPAGDVNGDGCADLIVGAGAVIDATTFASRAWIIPGFRGEWEPTAVDASSAIASVGFGDPLYEVTLEETAPDVLDAAPVGDLDGDGRGDLVAHNADHTVVFYGARDYSPELSVSTADAKFLPPPTTSETTDHLFGKPRAWAMKLGDLDADGKDDVWLEGRSDAFQVSYGKHFSGEARIEPDLTITTERGDQIADGAAGDLDGDGFPELILNVFDPRAESESSFIVPSTIYVLRGTGERLRGNIQLSDDDRWSVPVPQASAAAIQRVVLGGDINGDGSQELLTDSVSVVEDLENPFITDDVFLIPSSPRAPD